MMQRDLAGTEQRRATPDRVLRGAFACIAGCGRRPGVSRIDGAAQRPTAIVGAAPWTDAGWEAIAAFAGRNDVPVCSSCRGFDIVPSRHHCIADQLSTCASMPTN
jgi:hypothetical protein